MAEDATAWFLTTRRSAWARYHDDGEWAFHPPSAKRASGIRVGDEGIVYVTREGTSKPGAIGGRVRFTGTMSKAPGRTVYDRIYPFRVPFETVAFLEDPIVFVDLVEFLDFIKNKERWGTHLQGWSVKEIASTDARMLREAIARRARD